MKAPSARCGQELALQMLDRPAALAFHVRFRVFAMRGSTNGKLLDGRSHPLSDVRVSALRRQRPLNAGGAPTMQIARIRIDLV